MGRKRRAGSIPSPLLPSLPAAARPYGSSVWSARPREKKHATCCKGKKVAERSTPTLPTTSPHLSSASSTPSTSSVSLSVGPPARCPPQDRVKTFAGRASRTAVALDAEAGLTPSEATELLQASGWHLGPCWGSDCDCSSFQSVPSSTIRSSLMMCACGHRSCAHELVDANDDVGGVPLPQQRGPAQYRYFGGDRDNDAGVAAANEMGVRLRRLFSAIRNARAVGDCALFEDSEGVRGWGSGWFLSRLARTFTHQARQAMAALGGALHDPPAVARCLAAAEALLSGDASGQWTMPDSLPSSSIYQALGTGISSELDLAYWHARYTATSRFDTGSVVASPSDVVPPPEVYFVCLAFHPPSVAELRTLPGSPDLRGMLSHVFDLPIGPTDRSKSGSGNNAGGPHSEDDSEIRFPILTNPLLALAQASWLETAVSGSARSWVPHFPPRFGDNEGTMRGSDPALPPPVRARCDATRDWSARLMAFAVPNRRAVDACRRALEACGIGGGEGGGGGQGRRDGAAAGIVEIGAGLGYWKWVLEGRGNGVKKSISRVNFLAIDKDPSRLLSSRGRGGSAAVADREQRRGKAAAGGGRSRRNEGGRGTARASPVHNEYHGGAPSWAEVEPGGPERLRSLSAAAYPILLLCYPPPSVGEHGGSGAPVNGGSAGAGGNCMGADALEKFSGRFLLYVGEVGGDTGSPRLETVLRAGWGLVEEVDLPCFSCTANRLMVFVRKSAAPRHSILQHPGNGSAQKQWSPGGGGAGGPAKALYRCSGCGEPAAATGEQRGGIRLRRCRLTRALSYCSETCLASDCERWRANLEARHIHLAAGSVAEVAQRSKSFGGAFRDKKLFRRLAKSAWA